MKFPDGIAWLDGKYVPISEAKISVLDWGLLRSDATYDVVHVWKGRFFQLDAHVERFVQSAEKIHLTLPVSKTTLKQILAECVVRSGHEAAYVEMILTRGTSPTFSRDPRDAVNQLICFAIPFGWILKPDDHERGLSVRVSDIQRISPQSVDPTVKNYHWLDLVMGLYEAYENNADSVVLTDSHGNLTEGPGFNLFVVGKQGIATPADGILQGITRSTALRLAGEQQIPTVSRPIAPAELRTSLEAFATSTAGGIMPITRVDDHPIGDGKMGPVTRQLIQLYWEKHQDPEWSTAAADLTD